MTDYRSLDRLEVLRAGVPVGELTRTLKGSRFRYTEAYRTSGAGPIALHLPVREEGVIAEGVANLPTYFAGLLPEGIMFDASRTAIRASADDLFAILAATGFDAVRDIQVQVPGETRTTTMDLADASRFARLLASGRIEPGFITGLPGVEPKFSLGQIVRTSRSRRYIAKKKI